jgi:DHA2 family multidrug resistance protein
MALMPVAGFLVKKVQPKYLICFGLLVSSFSLYHLSGMEPGASFRVLAVARIFQACGFAFLFVPINTLAYSDLPKGKSNNASALINLMRNLGGSVGISMATTLLQRRSQIHQDRLVAHLTATSLQFQQRLHSLTQRFHTFGAGAVEDSRRATAAIMATVQKQAAMLSYLDVFVVLLLGALIVAALTVFLKDIKLGETEAAA